MGVFLAIMGIAVVGYLLVKGYSPHAVLLVVGLLLIAAAQLLGTGTVPLKQGTGLAPFDWFAFLRQSFSGTLSGVGLMIMAIGGFVAYMDKIGASEVLVDLAVKPLKIFRFNPHLAAAAFMPLGQALFVAIPSAAGLGLLLMASVFPVLRRLGVSRLSAAAVISCCTALGIGPASATTATAAENSGMDMVSFFVQYQLPITIPLSLICAVTLYFINVWGDRKAPKEPEHIEKATGAKAPGIYALLPILPLLLLVVFSELFQPFGRPIVLDTTTAMFLSFGVALIFEGIRHRNFKALMASVKEFWSGMAEMFKTVVTLIIAAELFAQGLIALGFLDALVQGSIGLGMGWIGIAALLVLLILLTSVLMGSGNASFFAFGPLAPGIAQQFGLPAVKLVLPMNLAASIGRTASPVSGVLIAVSELAEVKPFELAKRNALPMLIVAVSMFVLHLVQ
ncbi:C4-dicarboxylate ABC transporter [bacterium]|nr:C4-dicarboxylate ABC transporter [bacterium]